ncbi:hypothetical protein [Azospirillum sp. INR13]|uniref:hypothetical protein n=1 Tax=Azospirillum sp. INR13 TaxID=2596919 RepID=UPI00351C4045
MAGPQGQGEVAAVDNGDVLQDVGDQLPLLVVADQPGIAVEHGDAAVAPLGDEAADPAAGPAEVAALRRRIDDQRFLRHALADGRQQAVGDLVAQERRFLRGEGGGGGGEEEGDRQAECCLAERAGSQSAVIPAKAGIQLFRHRRSGSTWIPAFAG